MRLLKLPTDIYDSFIRDTGSLFLFVSLFIAEPYLTVLVMGIFALVSLATYIGVRRRIDRAGQSLTAAGINEQKSMYGVTRSIREVILYHQQESFLQSIGLALRAGMPSRIFLMVAGMLPAWLLEVAGFSTICGVTVWMIWVGRSMPEIIGAASMLMLTAWRVLPAVNRVVSLFVSIRGIKPQALPCLNLLETFIAESPPDSDSEPAPDFRCGLVAPLAGQFMVDGREMTPPEQTAYLQKIGFVPQSPMLMGGTVADNVAFSQWGQKYDREEVLEACRLAAMDFVLNDPQGIDKMLSGGAGASPGARPSGWPLPGLSSPNPTSSSLTRPPAPWIRPVKTSSPTPLPNCRGRRLCSSSPTA